MSGRRLLICGAVLALTLPAPAAAQGGKERFLRALEEFSNAAPGTRGDEGPVLVAAVAEMRRGLAEWDAQIATIEQRFKVEVASAPPPAAARMHAALGSIYLERGRVADAIVRLDAAPKLDPTFSEVHVLRGVAYDAAERPAEAADAYRALVRRDGGNPPAHAYLFLRAAEVHLKADTATGAEVRLKPDTTTPQNVALRDLLTAVEKGARTGGALFPVAGVVDDAGAPAPLFPLALYVDAFALLRAHRYDEAVAGLSAAVDVDPLVTDAGLKDPAVREALAALKGGDAAASLTALDAAAGRLQSAEVYRVAGMAYWNRKQYPQSVERLRRAVSLNTADERARVATADVLVESGDPAGARTALLDTVRALPISGLAHWKLGTLAQAMGDELEALRAFEAAAAHPLVAGASHLHHAIGRLHHNHLNLAAAAAAYGRRMHLAPNDAAAHADLGDIYRSQGALDLAMSEFAIAALLDPANTRALASLAQMHAAAGRDDAAVALLQRVTTLDESHTEARYALSRALLRLGRADEARRELEIFQRLQAQRMEEERRRFRENQREIDEALKAGTPAGLGQ